MSIITEDMVKSHIKDIKYIKAGEKTTIAIATLTSGFEVVTHSHVQKPEAYDSVIGEALCRERIYLKVWEFVGFAKAQETVKEEPVKEVPPATDTLEDFNDVLEAAKETVNG